MYSPNNRFKEAVRDFSQGQPIQLEADQELTENQKRQLLYQTKMYIQLEEVMSKLKTHLTPTEEIVDYMPFSAMENSAIGSTGFMGMMYVTTKEGKHYRDTFNDLRGNRLLVFTNERIIFFVILEFIEAELFYSYDYAEIDGIRLDPHKIGYFDWQAPKGEAKRKHYYWYTLDFQAGTHIFTEMLMEEDKQKFEALVAQIPRLQAILIDANVHRKTKFDYYFSNTKLWGRLFVLFWILFALYFFGTLIYQLITGDGMWYDLIHHNGATFSPPPFTPWL